MAPAPHQVFPLVVPCNGSLTCYEGFVTLPEDSVDCTNLWLRLSNVSKGQAPLEGAKFDCSPELGSALRGYEWLVRKRLADASSVAHFFLELKEMLQTHVKQRLPLHLSPPAYYSGIVDELMAVGWQDVAWVDKDLNAVRLSAEDEGGRQHEVTVCIPAGYPKQAPSLDVDLPAPLDMDWREGLGLRDIMDAFKEVLSEYQELWDCLDDLDSHAWILEPSGPPCTKLPRCCTHRVVGLPGHCSLSFTLDSACPKALPKVHFTGSEATVGHMKELWKSNSQLWSRISLPRANIECLLEMNLPSPNSAAIEDLSADCGICYSYRLMDPTMLDREGSVPDTACENPQCGRLFHPSCLAEWLRSLSDTRQAFNTLFGECPYCSQPVSVKASE